MLANYITTQKYICSKYLSKKRIIIIKKVIRAIRRNYAPSLVFLQICTFLECISHFKPR